MLFTVTLGYTHKGVQLQTYTRELTVEADSMPEAFGKATQELKTQLLIEAANVKPWAICYEHADDRRSGGA